MARQAKWDLRRQIREMASWLRPDTVAYKRDRPRNELKQLLHQHGPHIAGYIANRLDNMALWENQSAAYAILQGDNEGWSRLRLAFAYSSWSLRITHGQFLQAQAEGLGVDFPLVHGEGARCLALAFAFRDDVFAEWCGQLMLKNASDGFGFFDEWDDSPFYPFMARLYTIWKGDTATPKQEQLRRLGIYQDVINHWSEDESLAAALLRACDFHCDRTAQLEDEDTEFWRMPFQVFPAEILATQRIREETVGHTPAVSHPLLDTPIARPPMPVPLPDDELLASVVARFSEV
ncbi:MAG TPA: hypothetical protein VGE74_23825 [Gemmata sp.]